MTVSPVLGTAPEALEVAPPCAEPSAVCGQSRLAQTQRFCLLVPSQPLPVQPAWLEWEKGQANLFVKQFFENERVWVSQKEA